MKKNWLEWTVFGLSAALIAVVIGLLIYDLSSQGSQPPQVTVSLGSPVEQEGGFLVPVTVENKGDTTVEEALIEVTFKGAEEEKSELQIPYVPRRSRREGWVLFTQNPSNGSLEPRVVGFQKP